MRKMLDYSKLKKNITKIISERINQKAEVKEIFYYEAYPENDTREYSTDGKHKFMTYLKKGLDFQVRKKPIKQIKGETKGGTFIEEKGNMDTELTIDAVHHQKKFDIAVFFTGDSDFFALTKYLMARGKKCYVFSSHNNISHELRNGTSGYFEMMKIPELWGKELRYRKQKK
jgi:uncharacterized LabA/DUF88 family protein